MYEKYKENFDFEPDVTAEEVSGRLPPSRLAPSLLPPVQSRLAPKVRSISPQAQVD